MTGQIGWKIHHKCDACVCFGDEEAEEWSISIDAYCSVSEELKRWYEYIYPFMIGFISMI